MTTPNDADYVRDELWKQAYYLWYNARFNGYVAEKMADRHKAIDDVTKLLVALTASGSAVAGWSVWADGSIAKGWWAVLSGAAAFLSVVHSSLEIPARLKSWVELKGCYVQIRIELEGIRALISKDANFDATLVGEQIEHARIKLGEYEARLPSDFFATGRLKTRWQDDVDAGLPQSTIGA